MPNLLVAGLLASGWPQHWSSARRARCADRLTSLRPHFEPDLHLEADMLYVRYQRSAFAVGPLEYLLLQLVMGEPGEIISYDDLIWGLWGDHEPDDPLGTISVLTNRLRTKLKRVDPTFDKLKVQLREGIYWVRENHEKVQRGRVGVARYIYVGYADGLKVELSRLEHSFLTSLLKRGMIDRATVPAKNHATYKTIASSLNGKFERKLGIRLVVPGIHSLGQLRLNPNLLDPPQPR